jgi:helicase SWR1
LCLVYPSESDADAIESLFYSCNKHTVEEALLKKANQKRSLDEIVIQKGEFDWRSLFSSEQDMERALEGVDDVDDARAAQVATREAQTMEGLDDLDFGYEPREEPEPEEGQEAEEGDDEGEGETAQDYMLRFVESDRDFFSEWKI